MTWQQETMCLGLAIRFKQHYNRVSNDVYLIRSDRGIVVVALVETAFEKTAIKILSWEVIKYFNSFQEAEVYCDICSLKIGEKEKLEAKYKQQVDKLDRQAKHFFETCQSMNEGALVWLNQE